MKLAPESDAFHTKNQIIQEYLNYDEDEETVTGDSKDDEGINEVSLRIQQIGSTENVVIN
jgi:hypothetical protein